MLACTVIDGLRSLSIAGTEESGWTKWYTDNVPLAHARYVQYLRERAEGGNA